MINKYEPLFWRLNKNIRCVTKRRLHPPEAAFVDQLCHSVCVYVCLCLSWATLTQYCVRWFIDLQNDFADFLAEYMSNMIVILLLGILIFMILFIWCNLWPAPVFNMEICNGDHSPGIFEVPLAWNSLNFALLLRAVTFLTPIFLNQNCKIPKYDLSVS